MTLFGDKVVPIHDGRTLNLGPLVSASVQGPPPAARLGTQLRPLADLLRPASDGPAAPVQAPWGQTARPQSSVRPQVTIARSVNPKKKDRLVNITVKNLGLDLLIVQPFVRAQSRWQKGQYADALEV